MEKKKEIMSLSEYLDAACWTSNWTLGTSTYMLNKLSKINKLIDILGVYILGSYLIFWELTFWELTFCD